jgi:hypothetical protein
VEDQYKVWLARQAAELDVYMSSLLIVSGHSSVYPT